MNCNNYFDMTDQGDSFETWQGLRGPAGPQGPAGAPGAPGTSVELRGPVETTGDLPATASSSELWLVGSAAPYHGWFYNGEAWEDAGEIAVGPTGPQGPAGQDGTDGSNGVTFTPTVSSAGVISWTNDGGLPNPQSVNIKGPQGETGSTGPAGQDGTDGSNGVTFTPSVSSAGVISWTNDGGLPNPQSVNIKGPQGETGATGPAGPGVPAGGTAGQVLKKTSSTDYDTGWQTEDLGISGASVDDFVKIAAVDANGKPTAFGKGTPGGGDVTADMLGIVINGNSTPVGASAGQYVIVKNSTISGITDGLYTAAQAIPANTAIDSTYLTAVSEGGLNEVLSRSQWVLLWENANATSAFAQQTIPIDLSAYGAIVISFKISKDYNAMQQTQQIVFKGYQATIFTIASNAMWRFASVSSLGVEFSTGVFVNEYGKSSSDNNYIIPCMIYGIKGVQ